MIKEINLILLLLFNILCFTQEPLKIEEVFKHDSTTKAILYSSTLNWIVSNYSNVIEMSDKDAGVILLSGKEPFDQFDCYGGWIIILNFTSNIIDLKLY